MGYREILHPQPVKIGDGCTRWRLSDLERYEAARAGEQEPSPRKPEDERYLSVKQVADRYGASVPSVWRWCAQSRNSEAT